MSLTDDGARAAEARLGLSDIYDQASQPLLGKLLAALQVKEFYRRDRDYLVADGKVVPAGETWSHFGNLVQHSLEAKEGLTVGPEKRMLDSTSWWEYLSGYQRPGWLTIPALWTTD